MNKILDNADAKTLTYSEVLHHLKSLKRLKDPSKIASVKNAIVMSNVKLIAMVMKPYIKFRSIQPDDLFTEGVFGIYTAIEKFDTSSKAKFSTYAYWWIKQKIQRYVEENCLNRIDQNSVSIDKPIGHDDEGGKTIGDTIRIDMPVTCDDPTLSSRRSIKLALKDLTPHELYVLHYRFGL